MFVEFRDDTGRRTLLNLRCVMALQEGPKGECFAVSIAGVPVQMPEPYAAIAADLMADQEPMPGA